MPVNSALGVPASTPIATIKGYRRTVGAVVTFAREGRPSHRYCVTLKRYRALREWAVRLAGAPGTSGAWMRSSFTVSLWAAE
jgi:hypothetical protein